MLRINKFLLSVIEYLKQCYINMFLSRPKFENLFFILIIILLGYFIIGLIFSVANFYASIIGMHPGDIVYCLSMSEYSFYGIIGLISCFLIIGKLIRR